MTTKYAIIKCNGGGYYKRSYDSFGGHFTADLCSAAKWRTFEGAKRTADKRNTYDVAMGREARCSVLAVEE